MRVVAQTEVVATPELVWTFVTDPARYLHFMVGVTRWQVVSAHDRGLGARFRTLMHVRAADVGGEIEVVEYDEPRDLAWTSVTGIDQRGRWRLRAIAGSHPPRTHVELRLAYSVPGAGIGGWLAEQIAAPTVRSNLRRSVAELRRQVEHERRRIAAAARSGAATA